MEIPNQITVRLTEYDKKVISAISESHPHIADLAGLAREMWHQWYLTQTDENSKGKRLERIERMQVEMMEHLLSLENKIEKLSNTPVAA